MRLRLATFALAASAFAADAVGAHGVAYYVLVVAIAAGALAALGGLGAILDGSAAAPVDRALTALSAAALPFLLLAAATRAPLVAEAAPPAISATALVCSLGVFALQALLVAADAVERLRLGYRQLAEPLRSE
ncbi:MAG TPA: hypothetical protein VNT58_05845 [Gaiellaceae bacterium]|nr:hypothetical protein [Gaiellaceae bacterium]